MGLCEAARCSREGATAHVHHHHHSPGQVPRLDAPKGATVTLTQVRVDKYSPVEQFTTASATSADAPHAIAIPTDALAATYTELATLPWHTEYLY